MRSVTVEGVLINVERRGFIAARVKHEDQRLLGDGVAKLRPRVTPHRVRSKCKVRGKTASPHRICSRMTCIISPSDQWMGSWLYEAQSS